MVAKQATTEQNAAGTRRGKKGQRQKHRPQRTCVACGIKDGKRTLIRIVRSPEGEVAIDPTGRANGRGAYICAVRSCWDRALAKDALSRALKIKVDHPSAERLREYAQGLPEAASVDDQGKE